MLLIALTCFYRHKKQQFFSRKEKKEKRAKEEKKICKLKSNVAAAVKVFSIKYSFYFSVA
jgi:hypothetical protein